MLIISQHLDDGTWSVGNHAIIRMRERNISIPEIEFILRNGFHNQKKDTKSDNQNWKYTVDGKTLDKRSLRICVIFEGDMFIVTVIDLDL